MKSLQNPFLKQLYVKLSKNPEALRDLQFKNLAEAEVLLLTVDDLCQQFEKRPLPVIQAISLVGGAMLKQSQVKGLKLEELVQLHEDVKWAAETAFSAVMPEQGYIMPEKQTNN